MREGSFDMVIKGGIGLAWDKIRDREATAFLGVRGYSRDSVHNEGLDRLFSTLKCIRMIPRNRCSLIGR